MTNTKLSIWILAPTDTPPPFATPMFPDKIAQRIEFKKAATAMRTRDHDNGYMPLLGDEVNDHANMVALERNVAIEFFKRMGFSIRVAKEEVPIKGRFKDGTMDPYAVRQYLTTQRENGFSVDQNDMERALIAYLAWIKPEEHKDAVKTGDIRVVRLLLALLREGRQAGATSFLFLPQDINDTAA